MKCPIELRVSASSTGNGLQRSSQSSAHAVVEVLVPTAERCGPSQPHACNCKSAFFSTIQIHVFLHRQERTSDRYMSYKGTKMGPLTKLLRRCSKITWLAWRPMISFKPTRRASTLIWFKKVIIFTSSTLSIGPQHLQKKEVNNQLTSLMIDHFTTSMIRSLLIWYKFTI